MARRNMERSADWMAQAKRDLEHARHDIESGYFEWACFSAQQSAEKAIKAVFQKLGVETWGHSVADLLSELATSYEIPERLRAAGLSLDKAYIPSRYPDAHPSGSPGSRYIKAEAEGMTDDASQIVRFCEGVLSSLQS
jgi:HEPN domain-containing protein